MNNREIDAVVAEKVMGWQRYEADGIPSGCLWERRDNSVFPLDSFSTDPTASKKLFDKMFADGWAYTITQQVTDPAAEPLVRFRKHNWFRVIKEVSANGETFMLAGCLAALKAVGVEVDRP